MQKTEGTLADGATALRGDDDLPERDAVILEFERRPWQHPGAKEEAIRVELGLSAARYYQLLNAAIDTPAALRYDPMLIRRLRRLREGRGRGLAAGAAGRR